MMTHASKLKRHSFHGALSGVCKKGASPTQDCHNGVCVRYSNGQDVNEAVKLAKAAQVVIVFAATISSEGRDREDLTLGSQDALIEAVATAAGQKTVVVAVTP